MRRFLFLSLAACVTVAAPAAAQGVLVVSQNKCESASVGDIRAFSDTAWIPVAQELVDAGQLQAAGTAYHMWGDEWNVVMWYVADDVPAFLEAFSDLISRIQERYPDAMGTLTESCWEHKDSMYRQGRATTAAPEM